MSTTDIIADVVLALMQIMPNSEASYSPPVKFGSQRTSHMEPSTTSATVTRPVGERLQAGTEDAPVLDRPASLRRLHDSGAVYKYQELITSPVIPLCSSIL